MGSIAGWFAVATFVVLLVMFAVPPVVLGFLYWRDRLQNQHAVLRNFPLLGRLRYLFEHIGPEMRQYLFDEEWREIDGVSPETLE